MLLDFGILMTRSSRDQPRPPWSDAAPPAHDLGDFLREVVTPLQEALRQAIHSLRTPCRTPAELAKLLELDRTSAWRVWQAAFAASPEESALAISGETAVARFLDAVERHGREPGAVGDARASLGRFVDAVSSEIGDAATLKMILAAADSQIFDDARSMRLLHDAARLRVGAEADASLRINVRAMSQFEGLIDLASATVYSGLRTLRAGTPCVLSTRSLYVMNTAAENPQFRTTVFSRRPLGDAQGEAAPDAAMPGGATPIPVLEAASDLNGRSLWEIEAGGRAYACASGGRTGKRGESSICYGDILPASTTTFAAYDWMATGVDVCVPTETLVMDMYLSQEEHALGFVHEPRVYEHVHGERAGWGTRHIGPAYPGRFEHFVPGQPRPVMPEFAAYAAIAGRIEEQLGVALDRFHLFRWRMSVPIVNTSVLIYSEDPRSDSTKWPLNTASSSRLKADPSRVGPRDE